MLIIAVLGSKDARAVAMKLTPKSGENPQYGESWVLSLHEPTAEGWGQEPQVTPHVLRFTFLVSMSGGWARWFCSFVLYSQLNNNLIRIRNWAFKSIKNPHWEFLRYSPCRWERLSAFLLSHWFPSSLQALSQLCTASGFRSGMPRAFPSFWKPGAWTLEPPASFPVAFLQNYTFPFLPSPLQPQGPWLLGQTSACACHRAAVSRLSPRLLPVLTSAPVDQAADSQCRRAALCWRGYTQELCPTCQALFLSPGTQPCHPTSLPPREIGSSFPQFHSWLSASSPQI